MANKIAKPTSSPNDKESLGDFLHRILGIALIPITFLTLVYCFYFVISEALK